MSQFSTRSSSPDLDLPHPLLSRRQPRFYIPVSEPMRSRQASGHTTLHSHSSSASHPPSPLIPYSASGSVSGVPATIPVTGGGGSLSGLVATGSGASGRSGRSSRASLAALRSVLHEYSVPSPSGRATLDAEGLPIGSPGVDPDSSGFSRTDETGYRTPPLRPIPPYAYPAHSASHRHTHRRLHSYADTMASLGREAGAATGVDTDTAGLGTSAIATPAMTAIGMGRLAAEQMDALVEIHRVLYRGNEDVGDARGSWSEQTVEVRRVIERWFEGDCVYDHPLVRLTSRQSFLTHFILLHLTSTAYLPSLTPSALASYARSAGSRLIARLMNIEEAGDDLEIGPSPVKGAAKKGVAKGDRAKGLGLGLDDDEVGVRKKVRAAGKAAEGGATTQGKRRDDGQERWWKLWDVSADCREIGCMECYDGYHIAMIEQVVSLTLFPSLLDRKTRSIEPGFTPVDSSASLESTAAAGGAGGAAAAAAAAAAAKLEPPPPRSFARALVGCVASEFEYLLRWDLPISTVVEFNEVGKATHVRDVVDVRDVIDTFVPFAKRFNWITRRLTGLVTSSIGTLALALVPEHSATVTKHVRMPDSGKWVDLGRARGLECDLPQLASAIQLPSPLTPPGATTVAPPAGHLTSVPSTGGTVTGPVGSGPSVVGGHDTTQPRNSLGLEGMSTDALDAPDVDGGSA